MLKIALIASLAAMVSAMTMMTSTSRPCEDAPIDCPTKDKENNICANPIDSVAYCPRFCGKCQGPTAEYKVCRDFDKLCDNLVNSHYCMREIASELCPASCGLCPTTTPEITTTAQRFTEIPDPDCQDIDPDCVELLRISYCGSRPVVDKLCKRSCDLCPTVTVPIIANPSVMPGVSTESPPQGPTTPKVCKDYDVICDDPETANNCSFDGLIQLLCPETCGVCTPDAVVTTPLPTLPPLNSFMPSADNCYDNDRDCDTLIMSYSCGTDQIVTRLCPVSCQLCVPGLTTPSGVTGSVAPLECKDYSVDCSKLAPSCAIDPLVVRLCRKTCNADPCPPAPTTTTMMGGQTTVASATNNGDSNSSDRPTPVTSGPDVTTGGSGSGLGNNTMAPPAVTTAGPMGSTGSMVSEGSSSGPMKLTTSRLQLPSLNPFTSSGRCEDLDAQCNQLVVTFSCETNELLRRICPIACGACAQTTPSSSATGNMTTPTPQCADFDLQCQELKDFCQRSDLLVNRLCRLTCNLCDANITVPTPKPTEAGPLRCRVCVDPFCEREIESVRQCPEEAPLCASRVINNADGTHGLTKRCASKSECDSGYQGQSAGNATICTNYDPANVLQEPFICFYCCTSNECNKHAKPEQDTMYIPSP